MRRPIWTQRASDPQLPTLDTDLIADVCVVGAGIAGLSTAYLLALDGRSVVVLERGRVGGGQSERSTAHLSNALDDRYERIEKLHGLAASRLAAHSHTAAIDRIDTIVNAEWIDCQFERVDGFLFHDPGAPTGLDGELAAALRAGLPVERLSRTPVCDLGGPCLRFPDQAQFQPARYLAGLCGAAERRGVRLFTGAHVSAIEPDESGRTVHLRTRRGARVHAGAVVVATNTPIHERVAIHTKQTAYRTYVIALEIPQGSVSPALYWDDLDPYHYARVHREPGAYSDVLIVGGEDQRIGPLAGDEADERYARLDGWARKRFPAVGRTRARWSGEVFEPVDGLAFIGRSPNTESVFLATGDSGMGLTHGTIAGILIADLVAGRKNPWTKLYDPARKTPRSASRWLRENAATARRYGDWLQPGADLDAIAPGEGALVRRGMRKLAVYRDLEGSYHAFSARCRHLGGQVGWNSDDATWDCPCHGARYDCLGRVIEGPANDDLEPAELQK